MKTYEIMKPHLYESLGGEIACVPVQDVLTFLQRVENRIFDLQDGNVSLTQFQDEIKQAIIWVSP